MRKMRFVVLFIFLSFGVYAFCGELDETTKKEVEKNLAEMCSKSGADYIAARNRLVNFSFDISQYLAEVSKDENWTADNWCRAFCSAVVLLWRQNKRLCESCYDLKRLKPQEYLKLRRPEPNVIRELCELSKEAVPIFIEVYEKTFSLYKFTETLPEGFDGDVKSLRDSEQKALKVGIVVALGRLKDKRAYHFLAELMKRAAEDEDIRATAAESIGLIHAEGTVSFLSEFLSSDDENEKLRIGAALGLANEASEEALDVLLENLKKAEEKEPVRKAVAKALGLLASTWRPSSDKEKAEELRLRAEEALLMLLEKGSDEGVLEEVGISIVMLSNQQTLDKLKNIAETTDIPNVKRKAEELIETIKTRLSSETDK